MLLFDASIVLPSEKRGIAKQFKCYCLCSSANIQSAPDDPRAVELSSDLDRINRALDQCEKQIQGRLRAPTDSRNPTQDLTNRLQDNEVSVSHISNMSPLICLFDNNAHLTDCASRDLPRL